MNLSSTDKMADNYIEFISYTVACNLSTQSNLMKICGTIYFLNFLQAQCTQRGKENGIRF